MNVASRPVFNMSLVTPRSIGYSYVPGATLATATNQPPVSSFGTVHSPTQVGTKLLPPTVNNPGSLRGLIAATFTPSDNSNVKGTSAVVRGLFS